MRFTAVTTATTKTTATTETTDPTPGVVRSTDHAATAPASPRWWVPGLIVLGVLGAAIAVSCSSFVFPYLSSNSDEGAYLAQAETMASGHLFSDAPTVGRSAFRPWLAVERGHRFVFKFTPIHAGLLAAADVAAGSPRWALAVIAAADVVLLALLVRALGGSARASLGAGLLLALCPAWIVQSGVYLPYLSSLALLLAAASVPGQGCSHLALGLVRGGRRLLGCGVHGPPVRRGAAARPARPGRRHQPARPGRHTWQFRHGPHGGLCGRCLRRA